MADAAKRALADRRCGDAQRELVAVRDQALALDGGAEVSLVLADCMLAESGLQSGCQEARRPPSHAWTASSIVRLSGGTLEHVDVEPLVLGHDAPEALWVSADGAAFVGARSATDRCTVHVKAPLSGLWSAGPEQGRCDRVMLFGRAANDVYAALGTHVLRFDGKAWTDLAYPGGLVMSLTGGDDVFALDHGGTLYRDAGGIWTREPSPSLERALHLDHAWVAGSMLYVDAIDELNEPYVLRRAPIGAWTRRAGDPKNDHARSRSTWGAPDGTSFVASDLQVYTSQDLGTTWQASSLIPRAARTVWGRTSSDVYVGGEGGLTHWDGRAWSAAPFDRPVFLIAGSATELYVVTAPKQP